MRSTIAVGQMFLFREARNVFAIIDKYRCEIKLFTNEQNACARSNRTKRKEDNLSFILIGGRFVWNILNVVFSLRCLRHIGLVCNIFPTVPSFWSPTCRLVWRMVSCRIWVVKQLHSHRMNSLNCRSGHNIVITRQNRTLCMFHQLQDRFSNCNVPTLFRTS